MSEITVTRPWKAISATGWGTMKIKEELGDFGSRNLLIDCDGFDVYTTEEIDELCALLKSALAEVKSREAEDES